MGKLDKIQKAVEKGKEGPLIKLLSDKDVDVRVAAMEGIGKVGKDDGFNALVLYLTDSEPKVRAAAVSALGAMGNDHARAHLTHMLDTEKDAAVLAALKKAIESLRSIS